MSSANNTTDAVSQVLGEPVFVELSENAWKIRTNLILASVVAVAVVIADLHIEPDSQVFGLKFKGLNDTVLTNALVAVVAYLLIHFLWASIDTLLEWRLRITGTRVAFVTTGRFSSEEGDYPNDPRQSTLYNWWKDQAKKIGAVSPRLTEISAQLAQWEAKLKAEFTAGPDAMNIVNATSQLGTMREYLSHLERELKATVAAVTSARIPTSLARYDAWHGLFLRSQNLRWLLIEFLAPVIAGGTALFLLLAR